MRVLVSALSLIGMLFCAGQRLASQNIDSVVTSASRAPISIADQIQNPAERSAFVALLNKQDPQKLLSLARSFLDTYPQSAFLAPVAEKAARSSFDLGVLQSGLDYAHFSLLLLPENPLLLVAVADVQAQLQQNEAAIASARNALDYLDRFDRPAAISAREWPALKRKQQATAWFVTGRALVNESLQNSAAGARQPLLKQAISALSDAHDLNPSDMEFVYLLGLAYRYANDLPHAVVEFSTVCRHGKEFAAEAREQLGTIYNAAKPTPNTTFDDFVSNSERQASPIVKPPAIKAATSTIKPGAYAGSEKCTRCHVDIYHQWSQSGMAKMLRPYKRENVIGDFEKNNEFYVGDDIAIPKRKTTNHAGHDDALSLRAWSSRVAVTTSTSWKSDGRWHSYPVDYTIGSKWQQAYATKLPNGQIHVFPIQYSTIEKKWLNYWKVIDARG